ncbi:hypothetical protein BD779DRAFT_547154 [Infundibulicybe gibba]|nr:hypothetical protein BD779DRAFT_547154 [Infundibulicybe gibba]
MSNPLITPYIDLTATRYMQVAGTALLVSKRREFVSTVNYGSKAWRSKPGEVSVFCESILCLFCAFLEHRDASKHGGLVEVLLVQGILIARLQAMYAYNKMLLKFLLLLYVASGTSAIFVAAFSLRTNIVTAHPAPGLVVCSSLTPPGHIYALWIPILGFESIAFCLAAQKAFYHLWRNPFKGSSVMRFMEVVLRDSVIYFFIILAAYLVNTFIWRFASPNLLDVVHGMTLATVSLLGTRMLINLKDTKSSSSLKGGPGVELANVSGSRFRAWTQ